MTPTISPNSIEAAVVMYEALTGARYRVSDRLDEVLSALHNGLKDVLVELPWDEVRDGELHDRHQLILQRIQGGRVYFINALKTKGAVGTELGGPGEGPLRRVEPNGEESFSEVNFTTLFKIGGKAMLPLN